MHVKSSLENLCEQVQHEASLSLIASYMVDVEVMHMKVGKSACIFLQQRCLQLMKKDSV